jgi:MoaA/NifB/PqqE/SkfB family radical SAM enzyme
MKLAQAFQAPSWVTIQLLEQCNLRCRMCYEWGETGSYHQNSDQAMLDLPTVLRIVNECLPTRPMFEFFGGEPMLYPHLWEVIAAIRQGGSELAFPTNGTLLEENADRLVECGPNRLWVSIDGPKSINDRQRGTGVFKRVMRGLDALNAAKIRKGSRYPEVGITCVVTPSNCDYVEALFLQCLDLNLISCVSIELQSFATREQVKQYGDQLKADFGIAATPCAQAYVRDPDIFSGIDTVHLAQQMRAVADACAQCGIIFHSQPQTFDANTIRQYFGGQWQAMIDHKNRCGVPWVAAEISARGEVTTCHTFYDLPLGNVHQESLLDIWRGERVAQLRKRLRDGLLPICTACCRYYGGAGALSKPAHKDA